MPAATIRPRFNGRAPATLCHSELRVVYRWSRLKEEERLRFERLTSEYSLSLTAPGRHLPAALLFGSPTPSWDDHIYGDGDSKEGNRIVRKSERPVERMRVLRIPCPGPSTSTHAPQSLNSAFSSTIVRGGRRWERSCMRRGWHCLRPRQARAEVHIDYHAADHLSLFSVCFTPSFTAHSSQRGHHNRIRPRLLAAECTFLSMACVLPAMMPTRCAPCPLSSRGASPS